MKMVKNLTVANIKGTNFVRREDLDFTDDGNRFRGFSYKGLPITALYSEGSLYCSVRADYINYSDCPLELWLKTEEYKLCHKYNGTEEMLDLDDLADICEKVLVRLENLKKEFNEMEVDTTPIVKKVQSEVDKMESEVAWFRTVDWFGKFNNGDFEDFGMKRIARYYKELSNHLSRGKKLLEDLNTGNVEKSTLYKWTTWKDETQICGCNFYVERLHEFADGKRRY